MLLLHLKLNNLQLDHYKIHVSLVMTLKAILVYHKSMSVHSAVDVGYRCRQIKMCDSSNLY